MFRSRRRLLGHHRPNQKFKNECMLCTDAVDMSIANFGTVAVSTHGGSKVELWDRLTFIRPVNVAEYMWGYWFGRQGITERTFPYNFLTHPTNIFHNSLDWTNLITHNRYLEYIQSLVIWTPYEYQLKWGTTGLNHIPGRTLHGSDFSHILLTMIKPGDKGLWRQFDWTYERRVAKNIPFREDFWIILKLVANLRIWMRKAIKKVAYRTFLDWHNYNPSGPGTRSIKRKFHQI